MPLSPHGERMKQRMVEEYGDKKGQSVFYASVNAGKPGFENSEPSQRPNAIQRRIKRGLGEKD